MLDLKYKTILGVALPLMVSGFIQTLVYITDASFLSRYSTLAFDASGNAGLLYITVFIALMGMSDGAQILIARRVGQQNPDAVGKIFGTTALTLIGLSLILFTVLHQVVPAYLPQYSKHADLAQAQIDFLSYRCYGLLFAAVTLSIQSFFFAIGKTWVILVSAAIVALSNILMGYLFIFGTQYIPEMGIKGAALASTCADACGMLFLLCFLLFSKETRDYQLLSKFGFQLKAFWELVKVGGPLFFQGFVALGTWTLFFTWIEQMGKAELTISQNIRAVYFLAFIPIGGFAGTTKTYISQYMGAGKFDELKIIQRRIRILTFGCLLFFFHGAFLYPETLISWINPELAYIEGSADILQFVAGSIFLYGLISVKMHTINGSGNTNITFAIEMVSVTAYLVSAYLLIKVFQKPIFWVWSVEYAYFICMGLLSYGYLRFFNWQKKKI